ncbi:hypothetical protein FACS189415_0420 [Bacteroidia bacterium]|nr:hypothetical protein FACS189415_0420 [Bacteroidia bacterium]GHV71901.1 hypothetical protein FACS189420_8350 [Bacteroidia bacterium]
MKNRKWKKLGHIFNPIEHKLPNECYDFAQSPQALVFEDFVRIYFSTRKQEKSTGKYLSHIAFVDFDKSFTNIKRISDKTVIELGNLGCFDEHGIFPINPLRNGDKIFAYTCGWSRRISVSVETSIGLAISNDNGLTFNKIGEGPVLTSSLYEPALVGDAFVKKYNGVFHMWYIRGLGWKQDPNDNLPARIYKIAHAISSDGISWEKEEREQIIPNVLNADECQALPTVVKANDQYHMYFCYRYSTNFRNNADRGYKIGYAYSDDLINWTRDDENARITFSKKGWDSEMMCYPHVFECDDNLYMLYNGNAFGKYGFGIAVLEH